MSEPNKMSKPKKMSKLVNIFLVVLGALFLIGCGLIIASAVGAFAKKPNKKPNEKPNKPPLLHEKINYAVVNDSDFKNYKKVGVLVGGDKNGCTMNNSNPSQCLDTCTKNPECRGVFAYNRNATAPETKGRCCFARAFSSVSPIDKNSAYQGDTYIKSDFI